MPGKEYVTERTGSSCGGTAVNAYDEKKSIIELCLSHDLLRDDIDLCYAACVLNDREIIKLLESYEKFPQYLPQSGWFP